MKTGWKVTILCGAIIGCFVILTVGAGIAKPDFPKSTLTIDSAGVPHKFTVEVATTEKQKEFGLMFRRQMDADHGMIFLWAKPLVLTMWMKNTILPLDMLFLDGSGKITHVVANAKPESTDIISSIYPVNAVIELNGGTAQKLGITMGDSVESADLQAIQAAPPSPQ